MAYYKIVLENTQFVNKELLKYLTGLGIAGIEKAVANGSIKQRSFFDNVLYQVDKGLKVKLDDIETPIETQDIDKQMLSLVTPLPNKRLMIVPIKDPSKILVYLGVKFIRMSEVSFSQKYFMQNRMAILHVCGSLYVAPNRTVIGNSGKEVVVTLEQ